MQAHMPLAESLLGTELIMGPDRQHPVAPSEHALEKHSDAVMIRYLDVGDKGVDRLVEDYCRARSRIREDRRKLRAQRGLVRLRLAHAATPVERGAGFGASGGKSASNRSSAG
jgi:hypothetical protein